MPLSWRITPCLVLGLLLSACGGESPRTPVSEIDLEQQVSAVAEAADRSVAELWQVCAACHGDEGQGNQAMKAPALAAQSPWYLTRQLVNFRRGIRGGEEDPLGAQMGRLVAGLSDTAIDQLVAYIGDLPGAAPMATIDGDLENGADHYEMVCGACHGPMAEGNELLSAPRLAGVDDWYLLEQLVRFAAGTRGEHPDDRYGQQMRRMSGALPDQAVSRNVVAYIQSLAKSNR